MQRERTKLIAFTGLFAALIFLTTCLIHIPSGVNGGYVHFGDSLVYLSATLLPLPYAMTASAIGAGLSDLISPGGAVWILPTILIKPLCCLAFTRRQSILCRRNILAVCIGAAVTIIGYGIATAVISGSVYTAIAELPLALIQPTGSGICFLVWGGALDKTNVKQLLPLHVEGDKA